MARVSRMTLGAGSDNVVCSWGQARLTPFIQKEADVRMGWGPWLGFQTAGTGSAVPEVLGLRCCLGTRCRAGWSPSVVCLSFSDSCPGAPDWGLVKMEA